MIDFTLISNLTVGRATNPYAQVQGVIRRDILDHFSAKRNPEGSWADLKPETWARKTTGEMLRETGEYIESVKTKTLFETDETVTQVFTDMPGRKNRIPTFHELGWGKNKAQTRRSFIWLSDSAVAEIIDIVGAIVMEKL